MKTLIQLSFILIFYFCRDALSTTYLKCVCVSYDKCYFNYSLKGTDKDYHEEHEYPKNRPRPSCKSAIDVCCNHQNETSPTVVASGKSDQDDDDEWACGYVGKKVNDNGYGSNADASIGGFPWMVAVLKKPDDGQASYLCGGSVINKKAVLTAASEVHELKESQVIARIGQYNWKSKKEAHQDVKVEKILVHPQYDSESYVNNYALLILSESLESDLNVSSICLPNSDTNYDSNNCIETGWGEDADAVKNDGGVLKKSELSLIHRQNCENIYQMTYKNDNYSLHRSVICAGDNRFRAPCTGNAGSPLICQLKKEPGRYVQMGIASIAVCREKMKPGLYADLIIGRSWINQVIKSQGLNSDSYEP